MRAAFYTLGCKVNQYETQALEQLLAARGHEIVPFEGEADAYVINTCTVTVVSDKKSRQVIRRCRKMAPDAVVAVCGCYPQTHPGDVDRLGVDLIAGTGDRTGFVSLLEQAWTERQPLAALDDPFQRRTFEALPAGGLEGRTRAMLKVEDGCVNFCSYCIIPYARGRIRSLPLEAAAEQAARLAEEGYRELVLTGIEISSWGQDLGEGLSPIDLIEGVCRAAPDCRVRLGSLEPRTVTEDFCRRAAALDNLCPHFHLSMQSGCDAVLKRMNRKYDTARFYESVALLQDLVRPPRHYHRPDRGLPRGDGGGVWADPGLHPEMRLLRHAHLPLLPPPRYPGGQNARTGIQRRQGGAGSPGRPGGPGHAARLPGELGGGDRSRPL